MPAVPSNIIPVLALDPGIKTGICKAEIDISAGKAILVPSQEKLTLRQVGDLINLEGRNKWTPAHVVYESFEFRKNSRPGLELFPVKIIGVIEFADEYFDWMRFYPQTAAMGKGYYNDDKLKEKGVYVPAIPHAMDATRHLLHWLQFRRGAEFGVKEVVLGE